MKLKTAIFASICGYLAGVMGFFTARTVSVHAIRPETATEAKITRATAFEVVDATTGRTVGRWGSGGDNSRVLTISDEYGNPSIELSAGRGHQSLIFFEGKDRWIRMSLVANSTGFSALHLGDSRREARVSLGALDENHVPSKVPPNTWGLILRGPLSQTYLAAAVEGEYRSGSEKTSIRLLRSDGTYWVVQ